MSIMSLSLCEQSGVLTVFLILKYFLNILRILAPLILIFFCIKKCINSVMSGKPISGEVGQIAKNTIAALTVFLIPTLIMYALETLSDYSSIAQDFTKCINDANLEKIKELRNKEMQEALLEKKDSKLGEININTTATSSVHGKIKNISISYNKKDPEGRCGTYSSDYCAEIATVEYTNGKTVTYYMGYQNNHNLLDGSCRSHAFTCGMNAVNDSKYSTLDLQNYLYSFSDGVLKGREKFEKAISHFDVPATAYFDDISKSDAISLAKKSVDNGQPVIIFVAHSKCPDLAGSHHALLLLGYDSNGDVIFLDSTARYPSAKKRNMNELGKCLSDDSIAHNYMRMVVFN